MFAPGALGGLSSIATIGSTVLGGIGALGGASANSASASYAAAVARNNAQVAEQNAQYSIMSGLSQSEAQNYKTRGLLGTQKAQQSASGFDVNKGSAVDVRKSTAELGELDALTIMNNANIRAYNYRAQGANFLAESQLDTAKASYASEAGIYGLAGSLLGGASSLSDKWLNYQRTGVY